MLSELIYIQFKPSWWRRILKKKRDQKIGMMTISNQQTVESRKI